MKLSEIEKRPKRLDLAKVKKKLDLSDLAHVDNSVQATREERVLLLQLMQEIIDLDTNDKLDVALEDMRFLVVRHQENAIFVAMIQFNLSTGKPFFCYPQSSSARVSTGDIKDALAEFRFVFATAVMMT